MTESEMRAAAILEAKSWVGVRYHHQGRSKEGGVDCVWLLIRVYQSIGLIPADLDAGNYSRDWYEHSEHSLYMEGVAKYARPLGADEIPQPADVALYKVGKCVSHGAIILDDHLVIHANRKADKVEVAMRRETPLLKRLHSYWTPFR